MKSQKIASQKKEINPQLKPKINPRLKFMFLPLNHFGYRTSPLTSHCHVLITFHQPKEQHRKVRCGFSQRKERLLVANTIIPKIKMSPLKKFTYKY